MTVCKAMEISEETMEGNTKDLVHVAMDVDNDESLSVNDDVEGTMTRNDDAYNTQNCENNIAVESVQANSNSVKLNNESSSVSNSQNNDTSTFKSLFDESTTFNSQNNESSTLHSQNNESSTLDSQNNDSSTLDSQNNESLTLNSQYNESLDDESSTFNSQDNGPCTLNSQTDKPSTSKSQKQFHIETHLIPKASADEQNSELMGLGLEVYNQEDLEQGIIAQVDQALAKEEEERIKKFMERQMSAVQDDLRSTREELERVGKVIRTITSSKQVETNKEAKKHLEAAKRQRENKLNQMKKLKAKKKALMSKLDGKEVDSELVENDDDLQFFDQALSKGSNKETEEERMIKLGEMTPFGTVMKATDSLKTKNNIQSLVEKKPVMSKPAVVSDFEMFLQNKDVTYSSKKGKALKHKPQLGGKSSQSKSQSDHSDKITNAHPVASVSQTNKPNWFDEHDKKVYRTERDFTGLGVKRKLPRLEHNFSGDPELSDHGSEDRSDEDRTPSEDEYLPDTDQLDDEEWEGSPSPRKKKKTVVKKRKSAEHGSGDDERVLKGKYSPGKEDNYFKRVRDDGNFKYYQKRLKTYQKAEAARKKKQREEGLSDSDDEETEFEGGLKVPGKLWSKLFGYQKTGVKWLWELHCQQAGGIVGDEMGLGKTIQTISFLASLRTSRIRQRPFRYVGIGPTIIVCPATVLHQWVREFHKWWPEFRVAILHSSGSFTGTEDSMIHNIVNQHGVLITSYTSLVHKQDALLQHDWHYIILDEGHKIRNPDAQVTLACKQFRTPHRIILSGSPIQNNLKELWSLFDFVFPGKLGTLPDFMTHFSVPIVQGGYSNASQVQVQTAYKCACILRDTISPYLLRRMKTDVKSAIKLPGKSEQVLFCRLTDEQRDVYQEYLDSKECHAILAGKYKVFAGLITLRKICNHPDISTGGPRLLVGQSTNGDESLEYGYWRRSGKLIVVESLLKLWKKQGQRVLLFSQSKQMLDILEGFVKDRGYSYLRMDGGTSISARQPLINQYNSNPNIFVFLLTTRVGGLGVNLTGANRVVIFDPDWNPSTDMQARERAWRIGQNKQVTIYRLLTTGSIEEKIYHRQIFKQFLTNRVLKDPKQRRFFKTNDLYELFTLGTNDSQQVTETSALFAGTGSEVKIGQKVNRFDALKDEAIPVKRKDLKSKPNAVDKNTTTDDKTEKLRELARKLSMQIGQNSLTTPSSGNNTTEPDTSEKCAADVSSGHQKKKKKKSKRHKDAEFEGEKISHLSKLSDYQPSKKTDDAAENLSAHQDEYVLKKLFKKTGIQGAMKHDVIVESSKTDYALVEGEAEKVAREAAAALKRSRRQCMNALSGIPNWTGQRGAGSSNSRPKFGRKKNSLIADATAKSSSPVVKNDEKGKADPSKAFDGSLAGNRKNTGLFSTSKQNVMSSGELLEKMRARNISSSQECNDDDQVDNAAVNGESKDIELITDIRNFIAFQCHIDGQASTQELLDEFGVKLPPGHSAKFKAMLRQICDFDLSMDVGIWRLKSVYR